jgi:hypothetical protein
MKVLVGCETSGNTRRAFAARGHEAWSCDKLPADDGSEFHLQMDVRHVLHVFRGFFDLFIVHPDCTFMSSSGLHWNTRGRIEADGRPRAAHTDDAVAFAIEMMQADIPRIAMENPIGCLSTRYRKPDQYIQPYEFGHDASKNTCLWLKNLPPLVPTSFVPPRLVCDHCAQVFAYGLHKCPACGSGKYKPRWGNQTDSGQNKLTPSPDRWKLRSETYKGWSEAMATQWGSL